MGRCSPPAFFWYCVSRASTTPSDRCFPDFQRACERRRGGGGGMTASPLLGWLLLFLGWLLLWLGGHWHYWGNCHCSITWKCVMGGFRLVSDNLCACQGLAGMLVSSSHVVSHHVVWGWVMLG